MIVIYSTSERTSCRYKLFAACRLMVILEEDVLFCFGRVILPGSSASMHTPLVIISTEKGTSFPLFLFHL